MPSGDLLPIQDLPAFGIYLLGTDELGRDVFARMLQGSFVSLSIGFIAVGISLAIGIILGGLSGFYGNVKLGIVTVDTLIMRFTDVMLCFPTFFLILTVVALLPPSIYNIMIIIGLTSWMGTARFVRAEFLSLREQDFVVAAMALGLPERRIIFRHMVPNAIAPVLVSATIGVATAILTESALSFLGFGVRIVRTARSKGLEEDTVIYHHALRNALLPFVTMFGFLLPGLIGGSVIFEQIFAWPGLGRLGYEAILNRDFPLILTLNFFVAVLTLAGTLVSDILYAVVDPRIRLQ